MSIQVPTEILAELQAEGCLTVTELAQRVGLSVAPCYQTLRDEKLATLPGVQKLTSTIVMKRIVDERPLPVTPAGSRTPRNSPAT